MKCNLENALSTGIQALAKGANPWAAAGAAALGALTPGDPLYAPRPAGDTIGSPGASQAKKNTDWTGLL